jgi:Cu(I)/Ag(I) efflux system membrane protein CusA/SilA
MALLLRGRIRPEHSNPIARVLVASYRPILKVVLRHPYMVLLSAVVALAISVLPMQRLLFGGTVIDFPQIGSEFMLPLDEGDLLYMPTTMPGISVQKARELLQQTDRIIKSFPEVRTVFGKVGRAETATDPAPLSMIETTIVLEPEAEWRPGMTLRQLIRELDAAIQIPGLTNAWTMPIRARTDMLATGIRTPVGIKIAGPDLSILEEIGARIESELRELPGTRSVFAERVMAGNYVDIEVLREEAARHGLTTGDVLDVIASAVGGMNVTTTVEGLERYPVNVRYPREYRDNLAALRSLLVSTPSGLQVPLGQLADLQLAIGPPMIKSENARPNAWVFVDLDDTVDIGTYVRTARDAVSGIELPTGYALTWSGQFEYMERTNKRLQALVPITLGIIFLLLVMHLRRASDALLLMAPLPFAIVGAVWLMVALDFNMSVAVGVGIIAVAGLAAETALVMHVYLSDAVRRAARDHRLQNRSALLSALEEGAVRRVRPLIMTVCTTILGLLPIMIGSGVGTSVMKRIATPMVGGMATATLNTLFMIPAIFAIVLGLRYRNRWKELEGEQNREQIES